MLGNLILILSVICSKQLHTPTFVAICSMTITDSNGCLISLIILLVGKMTFITKICCLFHIESPLLRLLSLHVMQCFCFPFSTLWPFICWSANNISPIRLSSVHHKKYFEDTVLFFSSYCNWYKAVFTILILVQLKFIQLFKQYRF